MLRYLRWAPSMWRSEINTAVLEMLAVQPGERVLDVGAGMGAGSVLAARGGATVVALEPTPFMRRVLSGRRLLQRDRSRIEVVDGSAEEIPVADDSIDAVWAVNTMHHWVDVERGVAEIGRVIRPGGRVLLVDEDFHDPAHPDHDRFGGEGSADDHHGFTMVDADAMGTLLSAAGFGDVVAAKRDVGGRPAIVVTATGA
jgi:SAM-dependent methyltransferase